MVTTALTPLKRAHELARIGTRGDNGLVCVSCTAIPTGTENCRSEGGGSNMFRGGALGAGLELIPEGCGYFYLLQDANHVSSSVTVETASQQCGSVMVIMTAMIQVTSTTAATLQRHVSYVWFQLATLY